MRGRSAMLHSRHLFSGFLRCATCGGAMVVVTGGYGSPRYGCQQSWRNGVSVCDNRLTIRAKVADRYLLEGLRRELAAPSTVRYITDALAGALTHRLDERPRRRAEADAALTVSRQRLQRLIEAIEHGVAPVSVAPAIAERHAEIARLEATLHELDEPIAQRLAVMPGWVRQEIDSIVNLLSQTPELTKGEFQRLGVRVTMVPQTSDAGRKFYRADVVNALPCLSQSTEMGGSAPSTVDRSDPREAP
jgi:hypothetical protein